MEKSAAGGAPMTLVGVEPTGRRSPPAPRRLVQSTLFPHRSRENESDGNFKGDDVEIKEEGEDGEDECFCCSQGTKTRKRKGQGTPKKSAFKKTKENSPRKPTPKNNATRCASSDAKGIVTQGTSPPMPNLRLEAKLRAEENSRIFEGKQLHPFFSYWKAGKRNLEAADGSSCLLSERKNITIGPIHVFEKIQDDDASIDWSNWTFYDDPSTTGGCFGGKCFAQASEGEVKAIDSDERGTLLPRYDPSVYIRKEWNHCVSKQFEERGRKFETDEAALCCHVFEETACIQDSDQLMNSLWTDKYQPRRAMEVCGNTESVKLLNEWLHLWRERNLSGIKDSTGSQQHMWVNDHNYGSDSDSEYTEERRDLKNVLLVTGPVGSGKSAAIRACAKEQGFKILESNSSEFRNGVSVRQKFGEALESQTRSLETLMDPLSKDAMKSVKCLPGSGAEHVYDDEVVELIPVSDDETESQGDQPHLKPLILFEDVDITFPEDRGLVSAILQISEKAKGPVILTSNTTNHGLPDNLDRLDISFAMPSETELLGHLSTVCSAENVHIEPAVIEQLVKCCGGDIRKAILHLQFWFQSKRFTEARNVPNTFQPLRLDVEVGHRMLPKIIPWALPSCLSRLVEDEISKSPPSGTLTEVLVEEVDDEEMLKRLAINDEKDDMQAKKEVMLRMNFSLDDFSEFEDHVGVDCDNPISFGIPLSYHRNTRRRQNAIVSSDSEDELLHDRFGLHAGRDADTNLVLEDCTRFPSQFQNILNYNDMSDDESLPCNAKRPEDNCYNFEIADTPCMDNTCDSIEVSCVPESSFVPETQMDDEEKLSPADISCGHFPGAVEVSVSEASSNWKHRLFKSQEVHEKAFDTTAEPSHEIEAGSYLDDHVIGISGNYQVADECSRIDFVKPSRPGKKWRPDPMDESVQESWRRLRQMDLKPHVFSEPEDACGILELTHQLSNIIAEADLLHFMCQQMEDMELLDDSAEMLDLCGLSNELLRMASAITQQGFYSYAKDIIGQDPGSGITEDLRQETLASSSTDLPVERLSRFEARLSNTSSCRRYLEENQEKSKESLKSERMLSLLNAIKPLVPPRSYLAVQGFAFHEYAAYLGCISRFDTSHASCERPKRRRSQGSQHYLSTGSLMLSPNNVTALRRCSTYTKKIPF